MKKRRERTRLDVLKIELTEESDAALEAAGVSLDDLARLLVFGRRRRTRQGVEILYDTPPTDPKLAKRLRAIEGLSVLIVDGCVRECCRQTGLPAKRPKEEK